MSEEITITTEQLDDTDEISFDLPLSTFMPEEYILDGKVEKDKATISKDRMEEILKQNMNFSFKLFVEALEQQINKD